MSYRDLKALLVLRDLLVNQVLRDPEVMMENQVMMVKKENKDLRAFQEGALTYQDPPVNLGKKEIKENQESLALLEKMAILELQDLKENVANMHHLASQANLVNQESLVKMVNQENQEYLVVRDKKGKPLD